MRTGAEIKLALDAFVKRWSGYGGTERAEAQTLLNDLATGGILTDAISSQKWPGDAHVHVSLVNWVKGPAAFTDLKALQLELDRAVVAAYGWPESIAQDGAELVRLLTERNKEIAEGPRPYAPF